MNTNINTATIKSSYLPGIDFNPSASSAKIPCLQLDIIGEKSLSKINTQVNNICDQAEQQISNIVVLRFFPSDLNLSKWPGQVEIKDINQWERTVRRLERINALTIFISSGVVSGAGLDLLLASDYRISSQDFRWQMPVNDGQVWPGMALYRLVNQVGLAWSRRILLGTCEISAETAFDIGLIDEICETIPEIEPLVKLVISKMSNLEFSIRRQLLLEAPTTSFEDARGTYLAACDRELRRLARPVLGELSI